MIEGERDYSHLFSYTNLFVLNNISDFNSKSFFNISNPAVILETIKKVRFRDCLPMKRSSILPTKFNVVKCLERYLHLNYEGIVTCKTDPKIWVNEKLRRFFNKKPNVLVLSHQTSQSSCFPLYYKLVRSAFQKKCIAA